MPVRIFNNIPSLNAQRILGVNNDRLAQSVERISSGIRINKGADDAAGFILEWELLSDSGTRLGGWNIDSVEILRLVSYDSEDCIEPRPYGPGKVHSGGVAADLFHAGVPAVAAEFEAKIFAPLGGADPLPLRLTAMVRALGTIFEGGASPGLFAVLAEGPQRDLFAARNARFYGRWTCSLGGALAGSGQSLEESVRCAADVVTAIEGALVLSRGLGDTGPFHRVLRHLEEDLIALAPAHLVASAE